MPGVVKLNPDAILYDEAGHAVAVILDGATYRLGVDANLSKWLGSTAPTVGQKVMASSVPVTVASDQSLLGMKLYDENGDPINSSNPINIQFGYPDGAAIAFGDVALNSVTVAACRRTTYTEQTSNFTGSIASASANDTAAGTGARKVKITYIDATGTTRTTTEYTLNGTTGVNLAASGMCYIEEMEVSEVGSAAVNAGIITLYTGANKTGTVVGTIAASNNRTFWCHHYVLAGKVCRITGTLLGSTSSTVGAGCSAWLRTKELNVADKPEIQVTDILTLYGQSSMTPRIYTTSIPIAAGPARLVMYISSNTSTSQTYRASFDYIDVEA